jgi:chromosome partitioning protein
MKTLVVANQKGGVGKSAIATHLAFLSAEQGHRVLAVDIDSQGTMSRNLCGDAELPAGQAAQLFKGLKPSPTRCANNDNVDVIAGDKALSDVDESPKLVATALRDALRKYSGYALCVIDPPPTLGKRLKAALAAADYVVMPFSPTRESVDGLGELMDTIEDVKRTLNPNLTIVGLLPNLVNARSAAQVKALAEIQEAAPDLLLPCHVASRTSVADMLAQSRPVWWRSRGQSQRLAADEMRAACGYILKTVLKK